MLFCCFYSFSFLFIYLFIYFDFVNCNFSSLTCIFGQTNNKNPKDLKKVKIMIKCIKLFWYDVVFQLGCY